MLWDIKLSYLQKPKQKETLTGLHIAFHLVSTASRTPTNLPISQEVSRLHAPGHVPGWLFGHHRMLDPWARSLKKISQESQRCHVVAPGMGSEWLVILRADDLIQLWGLSEIQTQGLSNVSQGNSASF